MTKQKSLGASFDNEFEDEFESEFELVDAGANEGVALASDEAAEVTTPLSPEDALEHLLTLGRTQGYVSYDDVLKVMPEAESNMEQLEDIFAVLFEQGIDVGQAREEEPESMGEADMGDMGDMVDMAEIAELEMEAVEDDAFDLSQIEIDDSISLYLKEIGRVPLLTAEEEVDLAKRMERGRDSRRKLNDGLEDWEERERLLWFVRDGQAAQEHLIKANSRLVVSVAKKYVGRGVPFFGLDPGRQYRPDPCSKEI